MDPLGTLLILTGALLGLKALYLLAGDVEPDGTTAGGLKSRRTSLTTRRKNGPHRDG